MDRLITCFSRPSKIGLYLKDKFYIPLAFLLAFFVFFTGIYAVRCFNTPYLINSSTNCVYAINSSKEVPNVSFDGNVITGNKFVCENEDVYLSFLSDSSTPRIGKLSMNFKESEVEISNFLFSKTIKYSEIKSKDIFNLKDIKAGKMDSVVHFNTFITELTNLYNPVYATRIFIFDTIYYLFVVGIALLISLVFSIMVNPPIGMNLRIKMNMYDTLIIYPFLLFSVFFNISYFMYIGILGVAIFTFFTFTHIVRIRIKNDVK
ncbi:MAG: hypothetical protein IJU60_02295 [Acholeplasmatales bacterium]|nr:hypothetical protein [Acholeplasmatales bacterium]